MRIHRADLDIRDALRSQHLASRADDRRVLRTIGQHDAGIPFMQQAGSKQICQRQQSDKYAGANGRNQRGGQLFLHFHGVNGAGPPSRRPK